MPSKVLVFKRDLLVAIERKCLTLYQIDDDIVRLKDYDLTQIGGKFSCIDLVYVSYCGCDYLLTFGNEKEFEKTQFKCIVFEIKDLCLCFVKKVVIANQEVYRPVILFENYAGCNSTDMYCLVIGGYSDSVFHTYICSAFQINLHLLLSKWFEYPSSQTVCVEFKSFQFPITAGKAIKIGKKWYVFST